MNMIILKPTQGDEAYNEAAKVFKSMYKKVTGSNTLITECDDGKSDLVVIGSDSVNDFLMNEVLELKIKSLGIRYGTDDYCIYTYKKDDRRILVLAGGRGRSTIYAVYDYFEKFAGCHYFWDGDIIPHYESLPMENINITESPRFFYRGLRYFAHRGLKRFQAEHWSFEDWKTEIDWMVKKRLNFFMLRIGMDDIWQRAFPDDVPYPEGFRTITGDDANGYDDRSDFWTLKYRGELKIKVLEYARKMDLMYPVDCGTMTHWYSRTPIEFLEKKKPSFTVQETEHYTASDTGKVFDFTKKENMDYYMHLTETMVNEHEKSTALFHTIGLGERRMFKDKDKNFVLKLTAYRRIAENIRQRYPESKLLLASWDFIGWWTTEEVSKLFDELDPERTLLLDYTSETNDPNDSFINWGVVGKFPWIFGLFHAYESESELRGPYERSDERLKIAAEDPYCKGMVLWPELSHSDPLVLEYLSQNAWSPLKKTIEEITKDFCYNRYGKHASYMNECWQGILPFIKLGDWGGYTKRSLDDEKFIEYHPSWYTHQDMWTKLMIFMNGGNFKQDLFLKHFDFKIAKVLPMLDEIVRVLKKISDCNAFDNEFVMRDTVDITRTVLGRFMNYIIIKAITLRGNTKCVQILKQHYMTLLDIMAEILCLNTDFLIYHSLKELEAAAPTNPNFEITLKRNISNEYCSQPTYELVTQVYKYEGETVFDWLASAEKNSVPNFEKEYNDILKKFFNTPLKSIQPTNKTKPDLVILKAANEIKELSEVL